MPSVESADTTANYLLAALPSKDRQHFLALCEPVQLAVGETLAGPGERIRHGYFPTGSFISLTTPIGGRPGLEVGLVGNEGMLGIASLLGVNVSPLHARVQGSGAALRIDVLPFRAQIEHCPALQAVLHRYVYVVLTQFARKAACTRFHRLEARLARWLLAAHDRAHADAFHVTQELIATLLGVRRVGVTKAAQALQDRRLIHYSRGDITILDRGGLQAMSCACYAADKASYAQLFKRTIRTPVSQLDSGRIASRIA